jgi:hypothetical protein
MSRRRSDSDGGLPPLLVWLINAAKLSGKDAEGADIAGAPDALREFGALASRALPIHGVFVPNNPDICVEIQLSKAHLRFNQARQEFQKALKVVEAFDQRDPIESAHNHLRSVEDEATTMPDWRSVSSSLPYRVNKHTLSVTMPKSMTA